MRRGSSNAAIGGWQVSSIYIYQSGQPLTWGDVIFFGDPGDIATGPHTAEQWFNINAGFTRNSSTRPANHYRTWPFRFANVRGDALNNVALKAFNHPTFGLPQMDQFNSAFGQITSTQKYARQVQAMVRVSFLRGGAISRGSLRAGALTRYNARGKTAFVIRLE